MRKIFYVLCLFGILCKTMTAHAETVDLEQIIVTPERIEQPAEGAGSNVSVITSGDIARSNAAGIAEVLAAEPGIHVYSKGSSKTAVVDMRGYGDTAVSNVLVLVNGRRTNPPDISGTDWLQIPLGSVERIEIIRGAGSVLYGDNATGGVINIITREGRGQPSVNTALEYGSYRSRKESVEAIGSRNKLSYYAYTDDSQTDGYRDNSRVRALNGQARLGYDLTDLVSLGVEGGWHQDRYGLPGGLSASELETLGRRGSADANNFAKTNDHFVRVSIDLMPFEADGSFGKVSLVYGHRDRDTFGLVDFGAFGATEATRGIRTDSVNAKYALDHNLLGRPMKLVSGIDFDQDRNHILDTFSGTLSDDLLITRRELGYYAHADYEVIERWTLNAGVRRQDATYLFNRFDTAFFTNQKPHVTVFSGGLRYDYAKDSNVFVNAQETFRFLATDEWFDTFSGLNTDLKQQTGVEYQAGVKHSFSDVLKVGVTPFLTLNRNEIFFDPSNGPFGRNSNYSRTQRLGVDAQARLIVPAASLKRLEFFANYTWMDPHFGDGDFKDKFIPMVPQNQISAGWDLGLNSNWAWNVTGHYTGAQFAINDTANATAKVKPYATVDTKVSRRWKSVEMYAGVNNVFSEKYYEYVVKSASGVNKDFFPAPERSYIAGVTYSF